MSVPLLRVSLFGHRRRTADVFRHDHVLNELLQLLPRLYGVVELDSVTDYFLDISRLVKGSNALVQEAAIRWVRPHLADEELSFIMRIPTLPGLRGEVVVLANLQHLRVLISLREIWPAYSPIGVR